MNYKKVLQKQLESLREIVKNEHAAYDQIKTQLENGTPKPEAIGLDKYLFDFDLSLLDEVPSTVEELEDELEQYEKLLASIQKLVDDIREATKGIGQISRISLPIINNYMKKHQNLNVNQIVGVQPMMNGNFGNFSIPYKISKDIDSIDGSILED